MTYPHALYKLFLTFRHTKANPLIVRLALVNELILFQRDYRAEPLCFQ